ARRRAGSVRLRAPSAVASLAAGHVLPIHDAVLLDEPLPERPLVLARPPLELEDVLARTDEAPRLPVAAEAPLHVEGVRPPQERHLVHAPVAADAADTLRHVDAVVEVGEAGEVVDAVPVERLSRAVARADGLQHRRL